MPTPRLILASGSRYRRELLERLRIPFEVIPADIDESAHPGESPAGLASRLARQKAQAVARTVESGWVIGSDQVADCGGRILGKPGNALTAKQQLRAASGKTVTFWTALALANAANGIVEEALVRCDVDFRDLADDEIARYVAVENPVDCAGSFKAEGLGISLFRRMTTDDPTSLVGLPLMALCNALRREGILLPLHAG